MVRAGRTVETLSKHSLTIDIQNFPFLLLLSKREGERSNEQVGRVASPSPPSQRARTGSSRHLGRPGSDQDQERDHVLDVQVGGFQLDQKPVSQQLFSVSGFKTPLTGRGCLELSGAFRETSIKLPYIIYIINLIPPKRCC